MTSLFRQEVLSDRQAQWLGTVLLVPRLSHRLFAACAAVIIASVLGLLFFGEYPRKVHVGGLLVPEHGLMQVFAPQPGVITELYAKEGTEVQKGDRLLALSAELQSVSLGATQAEVARRLASRRESLREERSAIERLGAQQTRSLSARLAALAAEQSKLDSEIVLQRSRLAFAQKSIARRRALRQAGLISEEQVQEAEESEIEQSARLRDLERNRLTAERDRLTLEGDLRDLPLKSQSEMANVDRTIAAVEQDLAEAEARRELVLPAPGAGTVTAIQVERGSRADGKTPLLSVVPAGSKLEAHIYCLSRAIGFLRIGQRVLLRYQAYPYQKFGHHEGTVLSISRSAINPSELPSQLAGLTSLVGAGEPVYRVTVSLARQTVIAYGEPVPLQPGMLLEADILLERRRLIEWMLEPLFTLSGTWKR
jgi:membrane fusion protein